MTPSVRFAIPAALALTLECHSGLPLSTFPAPCLRESTCDLAVIGGDTTAAVGTIRGLVLRAFSREPIGNAQVSSRRAGQRVVSAGDGTFTFTGLRPGVDTLRVAFIGYHQTNVAVTVPQTGGLWVLVPLSVAPTKLYP